MRFALAVCCSVLHLKLKVSLAAENGYLSWFIPSFFPLELRTGLPWQFYFYICTPESNLHITRDPEEMVYATAV
jgi:hypothetical protein